MAEEQLLKTLLDMAGQLQKLDRRLRRLERIDIGSGGGAAALTWTNWSPTVTQAASVSASVNYAKYAIDGKVVHVEGRILVTGSSLSGSPIVIGNVPTSIQPTNSGDDTYQVGTCMIKDTMSAYYGGFLVAVDVDDWRIIQPDEGNYAGITPAFGLTNGDEITFIGTYEIS